jgi:hypothetical protein
MKKVIFTILSLFILSCSSDDNNDNNSGPSINSDLVGTWVGATTSDDNLTEVGVQTIIFNADGQMSPLLRNLHGILMPLQFMEL